MQQQSKEAALADSLCHQLIKTLHELCDCCKVENNMPDSEVALARGKVFQLAGYYVEAIDSYERALYCDPNLDEAAARLVNAQLRAHKPENALDTATKLAQRNPSYELKELASEQVINSMTLLGDALANNDRLDDSIEAYKLALDASKNDAFAAGRLAQAYLAAGDPKNALDLLPKIGANPRFRSLITLLELGQINPALLPKFTPGNIKDFIAVSAGGRPLFVEGVTRVASIVWGDDTWCGSFRALQ